MSQSKALAAAGAFASLRYRKSRDRIIELLSSAKGAKDYAERINKQRPWIGPRRRLTVHNGELR